VLIGRRPLHHAGLQGTLEPAQIRDVAAFLAKATNA